MKESTKRRISELGISENEFEPRTDNRIEKLEAKFTAFMQYQGLTVNDLGGGVYEVVKEQMPAGDYTHPIPYVDNMPVTAGLFYIFNDGNIWEAIKTGSGSAYDAEWFDIIAV